MLTGPWTKKIKSSPAQPCINALFLERSARTSISLRYSGAGVYSPAADENTVEFYQFRLTRASKLGAQAGHSNRFSNIMNPVNRQLIR